jgi:hypothetical protein
MADFRLIIVSIILATFSIASNALLIQKKEHLKKSEKNFAIVSLVGSVLILLAALYFGFKNRELARGAAAGRLRNAAGYLNNAPVY